MALSRLKAFQISIGPTRGVDTKFFLELVPTTDSWHMVGSVPREVELVSSFQSVVALQWHANVLDSECIRLSGCLADLRLMQGDGSA